MQTLDDSEIAQLPGALVQLAVKWARHRVFDTALAQRAESDFNRVNALCGWGKPDFDTSDPASPPVGGSGIEV